MLLLLLATSKVPAMLSTYICIIIYLTSVDVVELILLPTRRRPRYLWMMHVILLCSWVPLICFICMYLSYLVFHGVWRRRRKEENHEMKGSYFAKEKIVSRQQNARNGWNVSWGKRKGNNIIQAHTHKERVLISRERERKSQPPARRKWFRLG